MHRLVAYVPNGVQRFVIDRSDMLIGSGDACDIRLPFAGVGPQHARLRTDGDSLRIEDLGSRKGLLINGERAKAAALQVLDEIRLGSIALLVEDVVPEDGDETPPPVDEGPPPAPTITPARFLEHLAGLSHWVRSDSASSRTLESLTTELLNDFGGGVMFLFQGEVEQQNIKFVIATEARWLVSGEELLSQVRPALATTSEVGEASALEGTLDQRPAWIAFQAFRALERPYLLIIALPNFTPSGWSPLAALTTLGDLLILGLVHHVGQYQPILFSLSEQADLTLAPGLVVGESKSMKRVLEQLRAAVDPPVPVLLRGAPGVSKELLARSIHLSGPRRDRPFEVASCSGASPQQLAADLFGAEIDGRHGKVVREGKLEVADGGTLFLEDVEELPLELQSQLVRFLRSQQVLPQGSLIPRRVDVRLIAASTAPLETYAARDQMRIDLVHLLSRFAIDVPALRDRREDLPLLIQASVNRCCHETGKRVQGITVKALEALAVYDYPGNLPELENIVRRLVYLCPQGKPIDESMLPGEVRQATVQGLRPDVSGDLNLERLVEACERAAIREALHRSAGNKSEAARQLGLSRNGLAMKIKRLGLKT
ncbi:MAG: FHA domain-containing protein [Acidobacteria bacterium]|nr:MAG: FHA domain-containing protein [Acidobacteriota bacterium]